MEPMESGTSKFFRSAKSRKSPVLDKAGSSSKDEFNLWSDDSIEQAMSLLPGTIEQRSPIKSTNKLSVFQHVESPDFPDETIDTTAETPFTAGLTDEIQSLRTRFSYQQTTSDGVADVLTTVESKRKRSEAEAVVPCSSPVENRKSNATLGCVDPTDDVNEADWLSAESQPLSRRSGQNTQSSGSSKPYFSQGSEDFLIPDSEGEEEEDEEEKGVERRPSFSLDLARFAFTG